MAARKTSAPATCGSFVTAHPERITREAADGGDRLVTCKRLPMHKGECRGTLHAPAVAKVASPKQAGKASPRKAGKALDVAALLARIADGSLSATDALALVAQASKPARKASPRKVTRKASALPIVWGCKAQTVTGLVGKVIRTSPEQTTLRTADGDKTFVTSSLVRI